MCQVCLKLISHVEPIDFHFTGKAYWLFVVEMKGKLGCCSAVHMYCVVYFICKYKFCVGGVINNQFDHAFLANSSKAIGQPLMLGCNTSLTARKGDYWILTFCLQLCVTYVKWCSKYYYLLYLSIWWLHHVYCSLVDTSIMRCYAGSYFIV